MGGGKTGIIVARSMVENRKRYMGWGQIMVKTVKRTLDLIQ